MSFRYTLFLQIFGVIILFIKDQCSDVAGLSFYKKVKFIVSILFCLILSYYLVMKGKRVGSERAKISTERQNQPPISPKSSSAEFPHRASREFQIINEYFGDGQYESLENIYSPLGWRGGD